nr:MAG TPA: toxin [Caudoviricetes sp.]
MLVIFLIKFQSRSKRRIFCLLQFTDFCDILRIA